MKKSFPDSSNSSFVLFKCNSCGLEENIPKDVVNFFDTMDGGDHSIPPRFDCQKCSGSLSPIYYVNHSGIIYSL